jgi:hypothetical protein
MAARTDFLSRHVIFGIFERLEPSMRRKGSRAVLVGLSAAAGAFAAAAMLSAAIAPSARADDLAGILADVQAELADGQTAFGQAATDFGDGNTTGGLAELFIGTDDDLVGVPDILEVGATDELSGASLFSGNPFDVTFATPTTLAGATSEAQTFYTEGVTLANDITALPPTDYADTALDNALSTLDQWILPGQILDIGEFINSGL